MAFSDITYSITSGATDIPVTPRITDLVFSGQDDEDLGAYVRRIETEMVFGGADYSTLYDNWEAVGSCADLPFNVKYQGSTRYTGVLRIGGPNISWDIDNCRARATIDPSGAFSCFRQSWEEEQNLLDIVKPAATVQPLFGTLVEVTCGPVNNGGPIEILGYFELNVNACLSGNDDAYAMKRAYIEEITPGSSYDHYATWVTEQYTTNCSGGTPQPPVGDGWVLLTNDCAGSGTATYGRPPVTAYVGELSSTTGKYWDTTFEVVGNDVSSFDNGRSLSSLLTALADDCGLTVRSHFFGINPSGATPSGDVYDSAITFLQNVILFQKSDIKRPDAINNATVGNWTSRGILESLREQFNVRWKITASTMEIEHVSYFQASQGEDFSAYETIQGLHAYSGNETPIARQERWAFMEDTTYAFRGVPIRYENCVPYDAPAEEIHDIGPVNNDVDFIQYNTDQVSDEGFVFVNAYLDAGAGTYHFITINSPLNTQALRNGHLAIPTLLDKYHRHDRMLPEGKLNNNTVTFESTQRRKRQVELRVQMSIADFFDWDENDLVKTQMGWGKVDSFSYSCRTCTLTLNVEHE